MQEFVIIRGLPGIGKTTVALDYVKKGYRRVNRDKLREMLLFEAYTPQDESFLCRHMYAIAVGHKLRRGQLP